MTGSAAPEPGRFPGGFLWGAATSAYQIEGSPLADGAGPSNWHRFAHTPGNVANGDTGDVACDHYRRWDEDMQLLADLGLGAYRFSLAWSRIVPEGRGAVNQAGLDFYSRLVDRLLELEIQPCVTLYHWDHPAALDEHGAWLHPDMALWFADYARIAFRALGDRVPMWATLNEPWVVSHAGYVAGVHTPGHRSPADGARVAVNLLRAHGAAVAAYRTEASQRIGVVVNLEPKYAASDSAEDRRAVAHADAYMNRQYLDPVMLGRFPEELPEIFGSAWPDAAAEDVHLAREPIDFLGINYYTRAVVRDGDAHGNFPERAVAVPQTKSLRTETGWEVHPESFTRVLAWVKERYGDVPLYVTENGAAFPDPPVAPAGGVDDPLRVRYLRDHLRAAHAAMEQGVNLCGYFTWSLLDNFEWTCGYAKRFGLVHVDYATQRRTLKASARFYRDVVRSSGAAALGAGSLPPADASAEESTEGK